MTFPEISLIVCGAGGHMGRRALCLFPQLKAVLAREGIRLHLEAIIDPKLDSHEAIMGLLEAAVVEPYIDRPLPTLAEFLKHDDFRVNRKLGHEYLLYDASPTKGHIKHLVACRSSGIHYFGEKPLVTDHHQLDLLKTEIAAPGGARIFVDFVETHSAPLSAAITHLRDHRLSPHRVELCREGPGGLKKLISPKARKGIGGGAILDKAVHDLSILHALLTEFSLPMHQVSVNVTDWTLMPADIEAVFSEETRFLGVDNEPQTSQLQVINDVEHECADAVAQITLSGAGWEATVHTSWLGSRRATTLVQEVGLEPGDHIGDVQISYFGDPRVSLSVSDARLARIWAGNEELFLDFMYKNKKGRANEALNLTTKSPMLESQSDTVWQEFPTNSLARVFGTVCRAIAGADCKGFERFINPAAAVWVHDQIETCRHVVLNTRSATAEMENARSVVITSLKENLQPVKDGLVIRAIIFDLDNTIIDTKKAIANLQPLQDAFEAHFNINWDELQHEILRGNPVHVAASLIEGNKVRPESKNETAKNAILVACQNIDVNHDALLQGFAEARQTWERFGIQAALVTSGVWSLQAKKILAVEIANHFRPIVIDDVHCEGGKREAFDAIAKRLSLDPKQVLVIGDNASHELAAAKELGMRRIHVSVSNEPCPCGASEHVRALTELPAILTRWSNSSGESNSSA